MKIYARTLTRNLSGKLGESLGSFGILILDGRNTLETWKADARRLADREKAEGWRVIRCQNDRLVDSDQNPGCIVAEGLAE